MSDPGSGATTVDETPEDGFLDEEWLAAAPRASRWRLGLLLALGVSLVFLAGVQVERHLGSSAGGDTVAGGFPAGGVPEGLPDLGGAAPAGTAGAPGASDGGQAGGREGGDESPSVIGTLTKVHGDTWTVTDLGGTEHTVTVTEDTTLLTEKPLEKGDVAAGTTVTVSGTGDPDHLTATTITTR